MPTNPIELSELAEYTLKRVISSRSEWEAYLAFTGRLYPQRNTDQLLIYAQHPDATACAGITKWNEKKRWVNRGTKGIALIDSRSSSLRLRYVFDISDTYAAKEVSSPYIWKMSEDYQPPAMSKICERHGISRKHDFHDFLEEICEGVTNEKIDEYLVDFLSCRSDSLLEELDEHSASVFFRDTVIDSVRACVASRCEFMQDDFKEIRFQHLSEFSSFDTANCLCEAVSNISKTILLEMQYEVTRLHQEEERGNNYEREYSQEYGADLQPMRGLPAAERDSGGEILSARILRRETPTIPDGAPESNVLFPSPEELPGAASGGDRPASSGDFGQVDIGTDAGPGRNRAAEAEKSDGMGSENEQYSELREGDDSFRSDLRLNPYLPSVEQQLQNIMKAEDNESSAFSISQGDIDDILRGGSGIEGGKYRIALQFQKQESNKQNAKFLKNEYGWGGHFPALRDKEVHEMHDGKGIHLTLGSLLEPDERVDLSWDQVAKRIGLLIAADRYLTQKEKDYLPHYEEDMEKRRREVQARWDAEKAGPDRANATYVVREGDQVHLSGSVYEVTYLDQQNVVLADPSFPLLNKEVSRVEFDSLIRESQFNDRFIVETPSLTETETVQGDQANAAYQNEAKPISQKEDDQTSVSSGTAASPYIPSSERINYHITDDQLGAGGPKAKYAANIAAIRTLTAIEGQSRLATAEEQDVLSQYVGWGGISQAFDPKNEAWSKECTELKDLLNDQEYAAARESTLTAFYTPPVIIKSMYQTLENMGFKTGNIIDPGCGDGNFIGLLPESMNRSKFYGIEIDSISGRIAQQLYQKANIAVEGFEKTKLPDSFFDLAIGNVPFGQFKVADRKYDKFSFSIHDYFFAKALDKVRPGGIIAFITSSFTMDKQTANVRRYIAQRADLIGAVRLPNNAFKANAGTEVVSDILFLQKRDRVIDTEPNWTQLDRTEEGFLLNHYFVEHPEMVLGTLCEESTQYGMKLTCAPIDGANLGEQLQKALSNLNANFQESALELTEIETAQADVIPADPDVRNFSYCLYDGSIYYRENSSMTRKDFSGVPEKRIRGMMEIRDCLRTMIDEQLVGCSDEVLSSLQQRLNTLYDSYVQSNDRLNSRGNKLAFEDDSSYPLLCSLEIFDEESKFKAKADIFSKRTIGQEREITHVDTAAEALAVCIGDKAKVDLAFMADLIGNSTTEQDVEDELKGVIFKNPENELWETADEYLSGNVRLKLIAAQHYNELNDGIYTTNVEALTAAQPKDLEASEIDVRLGATWIDPEIIKAFAFEIFEVSPYYQRQIDVKYSPHTDSWYVQGKGKDTGNAATISFGTTRMNGYELLQDSLNLRSSQVFDTLDTPEGEKRVLNGKETILVQQKQDSLKEAFKDWIFRDPERREKLVRKYNDTFNAIVPRHYDGTHVRLVGINPEISLRKHQVDAVARALYGGNTLLAHCVGAGKTFTMASIAMEAKRLGLCQKSIFVVPNHLIQDWCGEFLRLYPAANLLMSTEKDFETANRKKFCARIATGDYDAVIIGHSQFERIPISAERQENLLNRQIEEISLGIEQVREENGERFTIKQMESLRKQLESKLEKLSANEKKDSVVTFEELGVDKVFVDEAHGYKNLFLYTKMRNVGGIAQTEAQKSTDLYTKCRYLDELTGGKGIVFATGTPVSNSMTELYTMMRYLQSADLERMGLASFDAWASTFGEVVTSMELAPEGTAYRPKSRFARFCNLPEMMNFWREATDIQTADMLNLPVPHAEYHTEVVEPTEIQRDLVKELGKRADVVRKGGVDPTEDNMLKITNDGRNLALDQRLIDPFLPDELDTKVNRCVENLYRIWRDTAAERSTQILFCDLSTPTAKAKTDGFCVYYDVRDKLLAKGIPENEIAFIHDANTQVKKAALFSKVRSGHVRIVLGSTAKMGAGTNIQDRLIALHHLDVPWRPSDIEQREGRIIRQRNKNEQVDIYRYVTKDTFDAYSWQTIENKQKFIGQIMTGKSPARSCEDVDSTALSYAEVKALASGNPQIKEKMDLEIVVTKLSALKANHRNEQFRLEDKVLKLLPEAVSKMEQHIVEFRADTALAANTADTEFSIEIEGKTYLEKALAMETVQVLAKLVPEKEFKRIGSFRGFSVELYASGLAGDIQMLAKGAGTYSFSLGMDAQGNATRLNNLINKIPDLLERSENELKNLQAQLTASKASLGIPFPQEQELQEKTARLNELNLLLSHDQEQPENDNEIEQE